MMFRQKSSQTLVGILNNLSMIFDSEIMTIVDNCLAENNIFASVSHQKEGIYRVLSA